jgi:hypothetical protein
VKAICTFCGHANRADAEKCAQCGGSLANAPRRASHISWASWVPAIPVVALLCFDYARGDNALAAVRAEFADTTAKIVAGQKDAARQVRAEHSRREVELDVNHAAMLKDARLLSGAEANERHAQEWQRRQNHDPAMAASVLEKTLLEVEQLGKNPALTDELALTKVAERVTPRGSRIEVTHGDNGFVVRVAFRLSAVDSEETGGATRHNSSAELRKEIEEVTARVIKDLFDYSGARGIQRVSVSCNRALVTGKDDNERLVMRSLYRAVIGAEQASQIVQWRRLSVAEVESMMKVDHDIISSVIINKGARSGLAMDPNQPLEF